MRLNYNGVELLMVRTAGFEMTTQYDQQSGLDPLYQEVTLSTAFVWHPGYTASGKVQAFPGGWGVQGDRMGPSIANLKHALGTPRGVLQLWAGKDLIYDVPAIDANTNLRYKCDPIGGPYPQEVKVEQVMGDKTAYGLFRVRFATQACNKYVVSHRWSSSAETDEAGFTTRFIEGYATFRQDFLEGLPAGTRKLVDAFRGAFNHPCPNGFRRKRVRVFVTPNGRELSYTIEDAEQAINLGGPTSLVFKIEGNATAGVEWPIKDIKALGTAVVQAGGGIAGAIFNPLSILTSLPGGIAWAWGNLMPRQQCNAICRAYGRAGAKRDDLALYATRVVLDRLAPIIGRGLAFVVSCYCTSSHDSDGVPFAEVRMEVMGLSPAALLAIYDPRNATQGMLNLSGTISGPADAPLTTPAKDDPTYPNPPFPASNQTRGRYVGALVSQILESADTVCAVTEAPIDVYEANPVTRDEPGPA